MMIRIVSSQLAEKRPNYGFNARTGEWVDMFKNGVVDPTKVTRSAVLNASSVAAEFVTTEAGVADIPEPKAPAAPAPTGMDY